MRGQNWRTCAGRRRGSVRAYARTRAGSARPVLADLLEPRLLLAAPPVVLGGRFLDAGAARLMFRFGADVGDTLAAADVLVQNLDTGTTLDPGGVTLAAYDAGSRIATFAF